VLTPRILKSAASWNPVLFRLVGRSSPYPVGWKLNVPQGFV